MTMVIGRRSKVNLTIHNIRLRNKNCTASTKTYYETKIIVEHAADGRPYFL
jgi:hypothetical protein